MRPDRCVIVYANRIREAFGDIPLIIGGVEASLRRFAHYDYWDDRVRRSVLIDSRADLLVYGMGERQLPEIANRLNDGWRVRDIRDIDGTAYLVNSEEELPDDAVILPTFEEVRDDKRKYADSVRIQYEQTDAVRGKTMVQKHQERFLVQNKPAMPLSTRELDKVYALPYERTYHPSYTEGVPAITEVKFSVTSSRGCYGNCNFCALAFHQGRVVTSRSHESIVAEANKMVWDPDFKGYIHDVGGPTANFRKPACDNQLKTGCCINKRCLYPKVCKNIKPDHKDYLSLLRKLRSIEGVKKVFVRSGIRFDYLIADKDDSFFRELCKHHVSGQLKVAPEHISDRVLSKMGKPEFSVYNRFYQKFYDINKAIGKKQFLVPYFMSSHPGSTLHDAIELALYFKKLNLSPEQVQDFYPTPGTISTCMFYTGLDPLTMEEVYVPRSYEEKQMQRALLQFGRPENYNLVKKALIKAGREDLIGFDKDCLIKPRQGFERRNTNVSKNTGRKSSVKGNKRKTSPGGGGNLKKRKNSGSGSSHRR